ncbi:MAG: BMC domain-containing protein [Ruminococcaceae bacterium]|nr:BMC domain-containing protein [Oscillospiraceae bacterium]
MVFDKPERIIQEYVPGKQVTLAHIIPNPVPDLYQKLGVLDVTGAIGIFTLTPSEIAIIAADVASKASEVKLGYVDRFSGSLLIYGDVSAVEASVQAVMHVLCDEMGFTSVPITRS